MPLPDPFATPSPQTPFAHPPIFGRFSSSFFLLIFFFAALATIVYSWTPFYAPDHHDLRRPLSCLIRFASRLHHAMFVCRLFSFLQVQLQNSYQSRTSLVHFALFAFITFFFFTRPSFVFDLAGLTTVLST